MFSSTTFLLAVAASGAAAGVLPRDGAQVASIAERAATSTTSKAAVSTTAPSTTSSSSAKVTDSSSTTSASDTADSAAPVMTSVGTYQKPTPTGSALVGQYTLPDMPNVCKDATVPLQTSFWVKESQVQIVPASGRWASDQPFNWTFSTNTSGIYFDSPSIPGASPPGTCNDPGSAECVALNMTARTDPQSFTLSMTAEDEMIESIIWSALENTNQTEPSATVWNKTGVAAPDSEPTDIAWQLTITGSSPCAHPIGDMSCHADNIPRTQDAWTTFGVNEFFNDWVEKNSGDFSGDSGKSMLEMFSNEFGTSPGNGEVCTIETSSCNTLSTCSDLPGGGMDVQSAQVYLVWVSLENLSDLFNRMYQALNIAHGDATDALPGFVKQFYDQGTPPADDPANPLDTASTVLGLIGGFLGFFPPLEEVAGVVDFAGTVVDGVNGFLPAGEKAEPPQPPSDFDDLSQLSTFLGNFVENSRGGLQNAYTDVFAFGSNITAILKDGAFVNRTALALDNSPAIDASVSYMDQYLAMKSLDNAYKTQNVFVTYIPYGEVVQVGPYDSDMNMPTTNFDESACASNFLPSSDDEKTLTVCFTDDWDLYGLPAGMARLTWYDPADASSTITSKENGHVTLVKGAPGYDSTAQMNTTEGAMWTYNVTDIIRGSLQSFTKGGFNYDPAVTTEITSDNPNQATDLATSLYKTQPGDAGSFSLPICILTNLNMWPTLFQTNKGGWAAPTYYDSYCACARTTDMHGTNFTSAVAGTGLEGLMHDPEGANSDCAFADLYGANSVALPKWY